MAAADSTDFQAYLESICSDEKYLGWQDFYTPTDALHRQRIEKKQLPRRLNLSLMVQTIVPPPPPETEAPGQEKTATEKTATEKVERLEVLAGLRKYAENHLLLVGKPGSGKSTALERLLWEEAEKARSYFCNEIKPHPLTPSRQRGGGQDNWLPVPKIPVLVELRRYKTSVLGIIGDFLFQHGCRLNEAEIEQLLLAGRFLLLVDGWNELPDEVVRRDVKIFREKYQRLTPMIFTMRELAGDIGIEKKLEMQPLTEAQMRQFVLTYLPEAGERLLQQLQGRLRELGETPLLLWMLCELFNSTGNIPPNLGLVFRCFAQSYDSQIKQDVSTDESRERWFLLLQHLAFEMMRGKTATDLRLTIAKQEAEDILTRFLTANQFDKPRECAFNWLNDLLKYHLIKLTNSNREIEFHHQLLQEYYAAERLLVQLPQLSDDTLKRDYLNYLKWTEPLALMLALVEDEAQALRVVKLALEVDLQLGARLAGEVKAEFQEKTVDLVVKLEIPQEIKDRLLNITRSRSAERLELVFDLGNEISNSTLLEDGSETALLRALKNEDSRVRSRAAEALGQIGTEAAITALLQALNDEDSGVCSNAAEALGQIGTEAAVPGLLQAFHDKNYELRESATYALGKLRSEAVIPTMLQALRHKDDEVRESAVYVSEQLGSEAAIPGLLRVIQDADSDVRWRAACVLGKLGNKAAIPVLLEVLNDEDYEYSVVPWRAACALVQLGYEAAIPVLLKALHDADYEDYEMYWFYEEAPKALGQLDAKMVIPALHQALHDTNPKARETAVKVLGQLDTEAAIPDLLQALNDEDPDVRRSVAEALGKIGKPELLPRLTPYLKTNNSLEASTAITGIQNRCKYYNYEIYISPVPEKQKPENPIIDTLNTLNKTLKTMSETPTNDFRGASFSNLGSVTGNIQGDVNNIGNQHNYAPEQNLAEAAAEIQQLLEQLAKNNQAIVQSDNQAVVVSAIHEEIKRNPTIKARLLNALKAGGTEALKQALDAIFKNPAVSISVEAIKGFIEAE